ncbi:MFS transporter [Acidisphaera sp. S103]|uniref:MFS transporter n=1 Tax=Acidisphaera sp. S103 TaxID=1747223 RepID=UPI00131EA199|nr:MFS transporter [Acidisphaera sp. S103]
MGQTTTANGWAWVREISRYQWMVFLIAWLGWSLDNTDFSLFALVLHPAMTELIGGHPTAADIGRVGGFLSMAGLLGWALGGFVFGILGDYFGRVRTLMFSVVLVAVFTALQGLTHSTLTFGICRFFTGVGTGAEIILGIPLVAEAFADMHRAKVLGIMMTGGGFGSLIGGQLFAIVGPYGWRYVMFTGVLPAIILVLLRRGLEEPEHFQAVAARRKAIRAQREQSAADQAYLRFTPAQLFSPGLRYATFIGLLFCLGTLLAIWTSAIWLPTIQGQLLARQGITGPAAAPFIGHGMMLWGLGGIIGYATFGFIADAMGRRATIIFYNVGTIAVGLYMYLWVDTWDLYPYLLPLFGYFVFGVFSGHAVYLPELFPTHVRATAVSFCNGSGRVVTSFGPLVAGLLVGIMGGAFNQATAIMTCFAGLSIIAALLGRETKDEVLPE